MHYTSGMDWEQIQREVENIVDATVSDAHIRLLFQDGRELSVPGTYNTQETITSDAAGNTYYGVEEYVSISNQYLPQRDLTNRIRIARTDTTGPCPVERYYTVLRAVNLRVGRTRLVLQEITTPQDTPRARWSRNEQQIDGPEYRRWTGE